jgi:predicted oxidoreductase
MPNPTYSRLISGTMTWGIWGKNFSTSEMAELIEHCVDQGITTFDHADIYGDYTTEAAFGKAFKESGTKRSDIQLISKCGIQLIGNTRPNKVKHYNYSKNYILQSVEDSLNKLQTNYLDLFLIHRPSPLMHPETIAEAATKLKNEGKIKQFGVSNFTMSQMTMLSKFIDISTNQIECSLIHPEAMFNGVLDYAITNNLISMAWSPLGNFYKERSEQTKRISKSLETLSKKYKATTDQLLLAWLLKHPANIHNVIGTGNFERISQSARSVEINLELEDWFILLEASKGHETP